MNPDTAGRERARILVVDDEPDAVDYLSLLVEQSGAEPLCCMSGKEALELARRGAIDLVLLDVVLPDCDGYQVAAQLRELAGADEFIPIIMISGLSGAAEKARGLQHADDYLTKPVSEAELTARIKAWLRNRSMYRELVLSRKLYQSLYHNVPHMYVSLDESYRITNCNNVFCRTTASPSAAMRGRPLTDFFDPAEAAALEHHLKRLKENAPAQQEPRFTLFAAHMGEKRIVTIDAAFADRQEPELSVVVALQDITARVRLEEEQKVARKQLYRSARMASVGTLASGVAHEINNPLTAILGFSSSLLNRCESGEAIAAEELREYLGVINSETMRCRDIIENLSNFARDRDYRPVPVRLVESVANAVKLARPRMVKSNASVVVTVDSSLWVLADPGRLGQVLVNILANALDFAHSPPQVCFEGKAIDGTSPRVSMTMTDNGPGIAPQVLPKIFDPFFTTKEIGRGTGLGLAMCHSIMEECGGSIDIVSEPGKGTCVILEFCAAPCGEGAEEA